MACMSAADGQRLCKRSLLGGNSNALLAVFEWLGNPAISKLPGWSWPSGVNCAPWEKDNEDHTADVGCHMCRVLDGSIKSCARHGLKWIVGNGCLRLQ